MASSAESALEARGHPYVVTHADTPREFDVSARAIPSMPEGLFPREPEEDLDSLEGNAPLETATSPLWHRGFTVGGPYIPSGQRRPPIFNYACRLPRPSMKDRVRRIFRAAGDGLDLIVLLNSTDPHIDRSFFYATGLTDGLFENCAAWLTPDGGCEVTTSALEEETAKRSGLPLHVFRTRDESERHLRRMLRGHGRIGVNAAELSHAGFSRIEKLGPKRARFVDVSQAILKTRLVKDAKEIELIQRACDIASRSFQETLPFIRPGVTESEVAAELVYRMQRSGATAASFRTIVGSGPNGAEPHYTAGSRKLRKGDLVVIDFGAMYEMYCSDITRTVSIGKATREQRLMYATVKQAQAAAMAKMRPGAKGKAVDAAARAYIDSTKYKGRFIHGLGHSLGLAVHDGGAMNPSSDLVLRPNMVFTNEPGVYVPGFGGVRIEDDVLIQRDGGRYMSSAPRELIEL